MSVTLTRPLNGFHLALSAEALAQADVTPDFEIWQDNAPVTPDNGQYPLELINGFLTFEIHATGYAADANPTPAWVPAAWNLPGTGNYVLVGQSNNFTSSQGIQTAQTFWAHGGNQGLSNIPDYEVPILGDATFTIPRTSPTVGLSFHVEVKTDGQGRYLQGVNSNNQPTTEEIRPKNPNVGDPYWEVFTTAAFGLSNPVQQEFKQIIIA